MPQLRVVRGPEPGRIFELTDDVVTIGRGRKNTIIIHDNEISREHCQLVKVLFDYEIVDLKSTNGTFINGRRVGETSVMLANKSIIELGDSIVLEYLTNTDSSIFTPPPGLISLETHSEQELSTHQASATNFYLVVRRRSQFMPEVYLLDSPLIDIGRHLDNAICLSENQVSRFHMRLNRTSQGFVLEDLESTNGTVVNGTRIKEPIILTPGDYITIGQSVEMWFTDNLRTLRMVPHTQSDQKLAPTDKLRIATERKADPAPEPPKSIPDTVRPPSAVLQASSADALESNSDVPNEADEETNNFPARLVVDALDKPDASSSAASSPKHSAASSDEIAKSIRATEESPEVSDSADPSQPDREPPAEL